MRWLAGLLCAGCSAFEPDTACFDLTSLPGEDEVVVRTATPDVDYDSLPQTRADAERAMHARLRAMVSGSSARVRCLLDEGEVACQPERLSVPWRAGPVAYFACTWHHPEAHHVPAALRQFYFFTEALEGLPAGATAPPRPG